MSRLGVEGVGRNREGEDGGEVIARGSIRPTATGILHDKVECLLGFDHFK